MKYFEKLKDPRWQKVRLKVMERDGFKCVSCGSKDKTLSVHHGAYHKEPWDTPSEMLYTLCEKCHKEAGKLLNDIRDNIGKICPMNYEMALEQIKEITENTCCDTHRMERTEWMVDCEGEWFGLDHNTRKEQIRHILFCLPDNIRRLISVIEINNGELIVTWTAEPTPARTGHVNIIWNDEGPVQHLLGSKK